MLTIYNREKEHLSQFKRLFKRNITQYNKDIIEKFDKYLSAQIISLKRRSKYLWILGKLAELFGKDFDKVTREEGDNAPIPAKLFFSLLLL
ncbi:hypothetical protein J4211_04310 [Candidatus Woesearchaeota archaeon]|nr:hypothetical protein [Candidatus Woesearchaeota archaeon]